MNNSCARKLITEVTNNFELLHQYITIHSASSFNPLETICLNHCPEIYPLLVEKQKCYEILKSFSEDIAVFAQFQTTTILALEFYPPLTRKIILLKIAEQIGMNNPENVKAKHVHDHAKSLGFHLPEHITS
ncbi:hypothetical protein ORJ04_12205 [Rheinheimera baltica]|uniref:Uncharacterized protein n=1 Tax=Rheinheimera baltica TaxID=67576 RepID=A0ABT9I1B1_9GAMM|nr:hypothetical protein [Rheinheimera baltica]MDP5136711.1 hypothetical protein [Rheinheimera baltica]